MDTIPELPELYRSGLYAVKSPVLTFSVFWLTEGEILRLRRWHSKDHVMPQNRGSGSGDRGDYGEVLSGKKRVGQALFEAAQTGYYRNQQPGMVMPEDRPEPEHVGYVEPTVKAHVRTPSAMAGSILRKVGPRKG